MIPWKLTRHLLWDFSGSIRLSERLYLDWFDAAVVDVVLGVVGKQEGRLGPGRVARPHLEQGQASPGLGTYLRRGYRSLAVAAAVGWLAAVTQAQTAQLSQWFLS